MLVVMHKKAAPEEVENVCERIKTMGLIPHPIPGAQRVAIGITGNMDTVDQRLLEALPGVIEVISVTKPYKLVSREMKPDDTIIGINGVRVGAGRITVIAGPCAVESLKQTIEIAQSVKKVGADILRGGAFKPRTSPYAFQGLGEEGLKILSQAKVETGLPVISEAVDTEVFGMVEEHVDIIQIGARNMQNYSLLKKAGRSQKPVFLKRGLSATIQEFLLAAEYIMAEGNYNVMMCERGIRTFSDYTRFTLDISSIPELKKVTHLPVFVDPSHASGKSEMVIPLSRAAVAAGADGVMVEVHCNPENALSDGAQSLNINAFENLMEELRGIARTIQTGNKVKEVR